MSKQYETWEVLKLIGENPCLKFQTVFSDGVIWEAFSRSDNKGVRCTYGKGSNSEDEDFISSDSNAMSRLWTKVEQLLPVSWEIAFELGLKGKKIKPKGQYLTYPDYECLHYAIKYLADRPGYFEKIMKDMWYVEN